MSVFDDVILEWNGKQKTVPADNVMRMLAKVEDHLTLHEMAQFAERGTAPLVRVSMAYCAALRHAGFDVTDQDVYKRLVESSSGDEGRTAISIVQSLQQMMVPPSDLDVKQTPEKDAKPGKPKAASNSQKRRTKRPSDSAG